MPELKNIEQLAPELGIKPVTVRRLIRSGALPYSRVGRRYVFTPAQHRGVPQIHRRQPGSFTGGKP
jgi:excisionase family DNA binding protein